MPTRFAIVGVQRTGTTWIRTTLNDHPSILALGEVFLYTHGRFPFGRRAGTDVAGNYRAYVTASRKRRLRHFFDRPRLVTEYLQHVYARPGLQAVGFKMMRTQVAAFPMVTDYLLRERIHIIHVVRKNVLKTLISRESAARRKLFHAEKSVPVKAVVLDVQSLRRSLDAISADNAYWERTFRASNYMQLAYEDFASDKVKQLDAIYDFLAVTPNHEVSSSLIKINPEAVSDVVVNFAEVERALDATPYAWCLAD